MRAKYVVMLGMIVIGLGWIGAAEASANTAPDQVHIDAAVEKAKKFLRKQQGKAVPDIDPEKTPNTGQQIDNSNTQFAILALWIGRRQPYSVPVDYPLKLAEKRFRRMQGDDGSWTYGQTGGAGMSHV